MSPIDTILSLLTKVRPGQTGQWMACCPAHADKTPSLSVRETPDGSVLLHCFSGCVVSDVVAALRLEWSDLYPPQQRTGREPKRTPPALTARDALEMLAEAAYRVVIVATDVKNGKKPTQQDIDCLIQHARRIIWLREETTWMGARHA